MAVRVNILTTYNGAGNKKALRDLALLQKQATLAGNGMAAGMFKASAGMQRAGAQMSKTGAFMSKNITLPIVAIGAVSVVMAAKFETSMKLIQTQAGASAKDVEELSTQVLELGAKGQHGPNELAKALYHLKSVGMDNATAMRALTQAEKLASVGGADLEQTTNAVAGAYKSGIKGAQTFSATVGTLNGIIGAGNLRMEDLNSALGTGFLVTAQTFGVSLTSVGAALAMMTSRGIPATRAAMALKMTFSALAAPSAVAEKAFSKIGLNSKKLAEILRSKGLGAGLAEIKAHLKGMSKTEQSIQLTKMFGAKSSQAILTLLGNLKDYDRTQKQVAANAGKFAELAAAQSEDATAKWDHFKSSMESAAILIGNQLLPTAISLADKLGAVGAWLNKLSPGTRKWVVQLGLIVAVGGPVLLILGKMTLGIGKLLGVLGNVTLAFGHGAKAAPKYARAIAGAAKGLALFVKQGALALVNLAKQAAAWAVHAAKQATYTAMGIALMVKDAAAKVAATAATVAHSVATKASAAAQWLLNAALTANPIGLIIVAITALVGVFVLLWTKCGWFRNFWIAVWDKVKAVAQAVWPVIKAVGEKIVGALQWAWDKVKVGVAWFWGWAGPYIKAGIQLWWKQIKLTFAIILAVVKTSWKLISAAVKGAIQNVKATIQTIQTIVAFVRGVFNAVRTVATTIGKSIASKVGDIWRGIKTTAQTVWNGVTGVVKSAWNNIAGFVNKIIGAFNWVISKVPGLSGKSIPVLPSGDDSRSAAAVARTARGPRGDDSRPAGIGDFAGSVTGALSSLNPLDLLNKVPWPSAPGGMFGGAAEALLTLVKEAVANLVKKALASVFSGGTGGGSAAVGGSGYAWAAALAQKFGLSVTSTFRPGAITAAGNVSDHGTFGRAADIAGGTGSMGSLWQYVKSTAGSWKQAIYGHQMINYGQLGSYGPSDHFDHVHLARAIGGDSRSPASGGARSGSSPLIGELHIHVAAGASPDEGYDAGEAAAEAFDQRAREMGRGY